MSCAICGIRKEKRFCPAVHGRICPQCCGEQREVTLDCPSDCPYLLQAREHEKPRSPDQIDPAGLFLQVEVSDQFMYEKEHLLMGLTYALAKAAHADRGLHDQDLISALAVLTKSYERIVNSGLHYEQPLTSDSQRRAAVEVEDMIKAYREAEQKHTGYSSLRDSDVLKALVFLLRPTFRHARGKPSHYLSRRQGVEQFANRPLQHLMPHFRCDFRQRLQHEAAFVHCGMGDGHRRRLEDCVAEEQNVDVDRSRTFSLQALAAHLLLDAQNCRHQLFRSLGRFETDSTVQEPCLVGKVDGFRLVE